MSAPAVSPARGAWFAAAVLLAIACSTSCSAASGRSGGNNQPTLASEYRVPERTHTAGDELLAMAPAGADVIVELDLDRLRANEVAGPLVQRLSGHLIGPVAASAVSGTGSDTSSDSGSGSGSSRDWWQATDAVLLCAYRVGEDNAETITLIRGDAPLGERLDPDISVLGAAELVAKVRAVRAGDVPSLADDRALMRVRTVAMPARADGGFLRAAGRLSFHARVELASRLELDVVPATLSVWADVADDFALVATLQGTEPDDGERLHTGAASALDELAQVPWIRTHNLHFLLRTVDISAHAQAVRMTLIIGPRRLNNLIARVMRSLPGDLEETPQPESP